MRKIKVGYEVVDIDVRIPITKEVKDEVLDKEIETLRRARIELEEKLREIDEKLRKLLRKKFVVEYKTEKRKGIYIKCPVCSANIRMVGEEFKGDIRCRCGNILTIS